MRSHPTWVRGLKFLYPHHIYHFQRVAPHVGAWIEIVVRTVVRTTPEVAPHVGAWIEISSAQAQGANVNVAPHVGAWIEIGYP